MAAKGPVGAPTCLSSIILHSYLPIFWKSVESVESVQNRNAAQGNMTFSAWRTIFLIGAGFYMFGAVVYAILIKADPQPWNYPKKDLTNADVDVEYKNNKISYL
jgi:hypothetical protein